MRKLWFFVLAIFAVSTVGCSSDGGGYDDPYASVRPGVTIYNCSENQMMVSGDAASIAVRLAMLIDEAAAKDLQGILRNYMSYYLDIGTLKSESFLKEIF